MAAADNFGVGLMADPIRLFVFGLGYSASRIAGAMKDHTRSVAGTVRKAATEMRYDAQGITTYFFDGKSPGAGIRAALSEASHVLVSIPPGQGDDPVMVHHGDDIIAAKNLRWIGYLSTVGIYGNYGGAWVSEQTTPHPRPGRSTIRLEAERAWQGLAGTCNLPLAIFRIAGIYGPGRNALNNLAAGRARRIVKSGQVFNRIHVCDITATILAAIERSADGIFNVTDDEPGPPQDVVEYAANLMDVPTPPDLPFEAADLSPMARSFYGENKRVSNRRIREELGVALRYPTYRDGLNAMWINGDWRGDIGI